MINGCGVVGASAATPLDLVVLVPMLGRPQHVVPLLDSVDQTAPGCRVVFLVSPADHAVHAAVDAVGRERVVVPFHPVGDYARKINIGVVDTTEPLIFTGASDLRFHPGWFEATRAHLTPGVGVVGTNDLGNPRVLRGDHATHFLVTRDYAQRGTIDEPNKIFHEGYPHEWVDDELVATARSRNAWAMALDAHVEHLHPVWGKGSADHLYRQAPARIRSGRKIFEHRQRLWANPAGHGTALAVVSDGRDQYLQRTIDSLDQQVAHPFAERWIFDDSGNRTYRRSLQHRYPTYRVVGDGPRRGYTAAMTRIWSTLASQSTTEWIFHLEGDFVFNRPINLTAMAQILRSNPHLAQMALRRQPWNDQEQAAGGVVEQNPAAYTDHHDPTGQHWLEHRLFWTCNPSLYRRTVCTTHPWPQCPQSEMAFANALFRAPSARCGYWGTRVDAPWVHHIGEHRTGKGY